MSRTCVRLQGMKFQKNCETFLRSARLIFSWMSAYRRSSLETKTYRCRVARHRCWVRPIASVRTSVRILTCIDWEVDMSSIEFGRVCGKFTERKHWRKSEVEINYFCFGKLIKLYLLNSTYEHVSVRICCVTESTPFTKNIQFPREFIAACGLM